MKVLYCGFDSGTSKSRKNGLKNMGYDVINFKVDNNILTNEKGEDIGLSIFQHFLPFC